MTTFGPSVWIIILTTLSFSTAERRFIFDTFVKIQTQFESWQSWSPCSGSCGETGTRFRTRGCHHVMVGFLKFSHECPIEGEETQTCVGDCSTLSTVIKTTLSQASTTSLQKHSTVKPVSYTRIWQTLVTLKGK
ncbi:uncharacterized protein LOC128175247 [Crassostrea angulata]|uniref:uncharacterized protein LOC128175247 n=1 Tax=Magallana angulata TaxID=2784310 RepID=UPI0022B1B0DF|nr:uncharacterized protein LOC128175247 [Crassostrea angulata]